MLQFTEEEQQRLKKKAAENPAVTAKLCCETREIYSRPVLVPKEGIANWNLYYYCPDCSVQLKFNPDDRYHHECPQCRRILTGEPYDSTWWGVVNRRNYDAAYSMGLIYVLTGDVSYARKTADILLEYAKYFEGYAVHGDIPYNGPGKSGAQTLDEANLQRNLAMAYDLVSDQLTEDEKAAVRDHLLIPGAEFLRKYRHDQLHNHEVIINAAIAIIGLIFSRDDLVQFAVYEPYGLLYQLEHGMLKENIWFEESFGYHFYALTSFFAYEKFAVHTEHSHIHHENYRRMMEVLLPYLDDENRMPMLNDTTYGHCLQSLVLYEFAYRELGTPIIGEIAARIYAGGQERASLEAFIYGADRLPDLWKRDADRECFHTAVGEPGHTILRGKDGRYLLFKHDSYGGEHDHYDRLGISFEAFGKTISTDLGTTGYGARLHYDFYKNTGAHNTVNIGEENQAPADAWLVSFYSDGDITYAEASCDWNRPYEMPDTFTIVQWSEENYRNVRMVRRIAWGPDYFAESFSVNGAPDAAAVDWVIHFSGQPVDEEILNTEEGEFSDRKPYRHFHDMAECGCGNDLRKSFADGEVRTDIYSCINSGTQYVGKGPDNPSFREINWIVERVVSSSGSEIVFRHVIESSKEPLIESVDFRDSTVEIKEKNGRIRILNI